MDPETFFDSFISTADVEAIIRLLGQIAVHPGEIADKRRALLQGLCPFINADGWWWVQFTLQNGQAHLFSVTDGGWTDDRQRDLATMVHYTPHAELINPHFRNQLDAGHHVTRTRSQMVPDPLWFSSPFYTEYFLPAAIHDFMGSCYPLPGNKVSSIGFHRNLGKPSFSQRDATLAHLITSQIPWLHAAGLDVPTAHVPPTLTSRQRQILFLLVHGLGTKQIAARTKLSQHTVNDHLKIIHKHYHVSSRQELIALFINGGLP